MTWISTDRVSPQLIIESNGWAIQAMQHCSSLINYRQFTNQQPYISNSSWVMFEFLLCCTTLSENMLIQQFLIYESSGGPFSNLISNENIRCTHEVCKQTYSWGPVSYKITFAITNATTFVIMDHNFRVFVLMYLILKNFVRFWIIIWMWTAIHWQPKVSHT